MAIDKRSPGCCTSVGDSQYPITIFLDTYQFPERYCTPTSPWLSGKAALMSFGGESGFETLQPSIFDPPDGDGLQVVEAVQWR